MTDYVLCQVHALAEVTVGHEGCDTMDSVCSVWDMQWGWRNRWAL